MSAVIDAFKNMLLNTKEFVDSLEPDVDPYHRVYDVSTFSDLIGDELERPFAIIAEDPSYSKTADGDQSLYLGGGAVQLMLALDFGNSYVFAPEFHETSDMEALRLFKVWEEAILRNMLYFPTNVVNYIKPTTHETIARSNRSDWRLRSAPEDYFYVVYQFGIGNQ